MAIDNNLSKILIGFDQVINAKLNQSSNYPPHNVIQCDDTHYIIEVAISGFAKEEISVEVVQNKLVVKGEHSHTTDPSWMFIHKGLASRDFEQVFPLAEFLEVKGADTMNGVLRIYIERKIPETAKPIVIEIK